jgi:hypothetical protein
VRRRFFRFSRELYSIAPIRRLTDVRLHAHHANSTHTRLHNVRARLRRRARRPPRDGGQAHLRQVRQVRLRPPVSRSFFSPGISALFRRFSGRKRVRTSPPDPAALATHREPRRAPERDTSRLSLCALIRARIGAEGPSSDRAAAARSRPTRADDPIIPRYPRSFSRAAFREPSRFAPRARVRNVFPRAKWIAPEPPLSPPSV